MKWYFLVFIAFVNFGYCEDNSAILNDIQSILHRLETELDHIQQDVGRMKHEMNEFRDRHRQNLRNVLNSLENQLDTKLFDDFDENLNSIDNFRGNLRDDVDTKLITNWKFKPGTDRFRKAIQFYDDKTVVSIRGLYSSGTNWVRELLKQNCEGVYHRNNIDQSVDSDGIYGWKHGFVTEFEVNNLLSIEAKDHRILLVVRDIFSWLSSTLHHTSDNGFFGYDIESSTRSLRTSNEKMYAFLSHKMKVPCPGHIFMKAYYSNCQSLLVNIDSVVSWRNKLYSNILELTQQHPNKFFLVRYEDLAAENGLNYFKELIEKLNITKSCKHENDIASVTSYVKYGRQRGNNFSQNAAKKKLCNSINSRNYAVILKYVDISLEAEIGYNIPKSFVEFQRKYSCY